MSEVDSKFASTYARPTLIFRQERHRWTRTWPQFKLLYSEGVQRPSRCSEGILEQWSRVHKSFEYGTAQTPMIGLRSSGTRYMSSWIVRHTSCCGSAAMGAEAIWMHRYIKKCQLKHTAPG